MKNQDLFQEPTINYASTTSDWADDCSFDDDWLVSGSDLFESFDELSE